MPAKLTYAAIGEAAEIDPKTAKAALTNAGKQLAGLTKAEAVGIVRATSDPAMVAGHNSVGRGETADRPVSELASARARSEQARAKKLELENAKREGEYVSRAAVIATGVDIITRARTALLAVGTRAAPKLTDKRDPVEIARIIEGEIRDVLGVISDPQAFVDAVLE